MIKRQIQSELQFQLDNNAAVALLGPRQVGKTTAALEIAKTPPAIYLDLESPEDIPKLNDPLSFFEFHKDKLIILDEIQRVPNLFTTLRGVIDKRRRDGQKHSQFLLLGSASMDLLKQASESLAGRIHYIEMNGINLMEYTQGQSDQTLHFRGGFPESLLASSDKASNQWRENFIRTYLERDIPQLGFRIPAMRLRRLWTMLAHLQGETINMASLATNLEVDAKTISYYIDILTDLLLVRRLAPWHNNTKKRLIKSPRIYIRDSGLLHSLLNISSYDSLLAHPILGKSWEAYVIENIFSVLPNNAQAYFYRTSSGTEIDIILKLADAEIWAIEIKKNRAPSIKKTFHQACEDIKATRKFVVYGGSDNFFINQDTQVISLLKLMQILHGTT